MERRAVVAGQFYHSDPAKLREQIEGFMVRDAAKEEVKAVLCPHAGLVYSGAVAGAVYSRVKYPNTFVLLGPNHTGLGFRVSMMSEGTWEIPTATIAIDTTLAALIRRRATLITEDTQAHLFEHSLEVQLPFISHVSPTARIVPISVMSATLDEMKETGAAIAQAVREAGYPVVLVASSDMSHFVPDTVARKKDRLAIEKVLNLDPDGLYNVVVEEDISMCGFMPTVIMLSAAKTLGATEAALVKYATSAETSGDYESVVGYAGIIIK